MTTVGALCSRSVVTTARVRSATDAARLMRDRHVGTLVVTENDLPGEPPIGIVTDRDLVVEIMAIGLDSDELCVGEIMTPAPVIAREYETARAALQRMCHSGVRRLPVVSEAGALVGIVAADDLLRALASDVTAIASIGLHGRAREAALRASVSL